MEFFFAPEIKNRLKHILTRLDFPHLDSKRIICFKSVGSKSRAYARIWSLPTIWQKALKIKAYYCIEILSERFNKLNIEQQTKVLIHELLHIPKTFSGALLPHRGRGKRRIDKRTVEKIYERFKYG